MPEVNTPVVCKKELRYEQEENMQELRSLVTAAVDMGPQLEDCILLVVGEPEPLGRLEVSTPEPPGKRKAPELHNSGRMEVSKELQCKREREDCMKDDCKKVGCKEEDYKKEGCKEEDYKKVGCIQIGYTQGGCIQVDYKLEDCKLEGYKLEGYEQEDYMQEDYMQEECRQEDYKQEECILRDCKPADGKKVLVCCTLELCSWAWVLRTEL